DASRISWLDSFRTVDGLETVSASVAVNDPASGAVRGVLNVQFFDDMFPAMLREAVSHRADTQSMLFNRQGDLIATGQPAIRDRHSALLAALPAPPDALPLDRPIPVEFTYAGVTYVGAVKGF